MTMTATKKNNTLKVGSMKMTMQQLHKWKENRRKFDKTLDNTVIDKALVEMAKCVRYFEQNKLWEIHL